jgi:hypothetical protein
MGRNFDDYSDFQKIPGMPILLQHSVCRTLWEWVVRFPNKEVILAAAAVKVIEYK